MEKLSIIIPAYNEGERIERTLEEYCTFFKNQGVAYEILVVLNACTDNTLDIVKKQQKKFGEIKFLEFEQGGKGFAIAEGFKNALERENDLIGFVDADMATPPESFYDLVGNIVDSGGVIASRWLNESIIKTKQSLLRRFVSRGFNFIVRSFFLFPYEDTQCGAKLFKKKVIKEIVNELCLTEWAFDINLLYLCKKKKFKIVEMPTVWEDKTGSKINKLGKTSFQMFSGVLRLRLIYSPFEKILRPAKFILKIGNHLVNLK